MIVVISKNFTMSKWCKLVFITHTGPYIYRHNHTGCMHLNNSQNKLALLLDNVRFGTQLHMFAYKNMKLFHRSSTNRLQSFCVTPILVVGFLEATCLANKTTLS